MIDKLPQIIPIAVFLIAVGYAAGNARKLNGWHIVLLLFVIGFFVAEFDGDKPMVYTLLGSFFAGYLLPQVGALEGFGSSISEFINNIRYRSAYEDIRRKEEEVDALRREYEQMNREQNRQRADQERQRRQEEFRRSRQKSQNKDSGASSGGGNAGSGQRQHSSAGSADYRRPASTAERDKHLETLGLAPGREYSYAEIKKAYRRMASKYHPDKHQGGSTEFIRETTKRFQAIRNAYKLLAINT